MPYMPHSSILHAILLMRCSHGRSDARPIPAGEHGRGQEVTGPRGRRTATSTLFWDQCLKLFPAYAVNAHRTRRVIGPTWRPCVSDADGSLQFDGVMHPCLQVAAGIVEAIWDPEADGKTFEFVGPKEYGDFDIINIS